MRRGRLTCVSRFVGVRHQVERPCSRGGQDLLDQGIQVAFLELESQGRQIEDAFRLFYEMSRLLLDLDFSREPSIGVIGHPIPQRAHFRLVTRHSGHDGWIRMAQEMLTDEPIFQRKVHAQLARERGEMKPNRGAAACQLNPIEKSRNVVRELEQLTMLFMQIVDCRHIVSRYPSGSIPPESSLVYLRAAIIRALGDCRGDRLHRGRRHCRRLDRRGDRLRHGYRRLRRR